MSTYFYASHQQMQNSHNMMQSSSHHGRTRRNQRMSSAQPSSRQHRQQHQQPKQIEKSIAVEAPTLTTFRARFEAGRSFDLDDDLEFCPNLLTWDERQSVTSGSSDRSSLSSGSPDSSPLQHQIQPHMVPTLSLPTSSYVSPPTAYAMNNLHLHQPSAIRTRKAIPIVNPDTRSRMSPPSSISPSMMQQGQRPRW
ncbi:hypothetical protein LTS08_003373 [Lithohypha guttulata]|uniref:uncharacterized protein n=1 Tax=Lithohypha guttulata TaxID=1690604 RepID=UPI002DDF3BA7|nr:hypothetical protein LTR51_008751 [Lithohypha guttulata]KAK5103949.1 hypothetical protein LTS08_003373 [Lithohypha guttulata]